MRFGPQILARCDALAAISEEPGRLTRRYLTPQHREAGEKIAAWMREAGMEAGFDALGNVVGRYAAGLPDAPVVVTGSHMDTVVDAGRYDGIFGILSPIACVADLHARGRRLPFTLEVVAFGDEEGVRFGVSMLGSRALAGRFDLAALECRDADGVSLRDALCAFGGDPGAIPALARRDIAAYVEAHIEQGPVLQDAGLPVGVVTSIAGGTRLRVRVEGVAGHAGTVPMPARQDALAAAAEMVLAIEDIARKTDGLVATIGQLRVPGGAVHRRRAAMPKLHRRERAVGMHGLGHHRMGAHVGLVPERGEWKWAVVRRWMHRTRAGRDDGPAAFGLHAPERRADVRVGVGHPRGVRNLEEPVLRGLGADPDRIEQDVESRVARHRPAFVELSYSCAAATPCQALLFAAARTMCATRHRHPDAVSC